MSTSRMDKYRDIDNEVDTQKRTSRNRNIYDDIKTSDYENVNLSNNVSVINTPLEDLDIDKIKKILDEKYKEKSRNKKVEVLESDDTEELENTKEYDLKKVLEEAHKNKTTDYDHERFMKLRETQYDILKSLNVERPPETDNQDGLTTEEANLMNLIKTVNYNAEKNKLSQQNNDKETIEEDLFSDLMGNDNTEVLKPMTFDDNEENSEDENPTETVGNKKPTIVEELERTKQLSKTEILKAMSKYKEQKEDDTDDINDILDAANEDDENDDETQEQTLTKTEELSNSFYTGKFQISKKDLDDFKDLEGDMTSGSIIIKILIILIVLIILALAIFLLNKYLNLGLF